jgi:hypothetical protein
VPKEHWPVKGSTERASIEQNWQQPYGDRINEVVFIGRYMDRELIETAFAACRLTLTEIRKGSGHWRKLPDQFPAWTAVEASEEEMEPL